MKKLLALVLALVMTMSLVTISNAAFTDAKDIEHDEAVEVMNALGVIAGMPDGSYAPKGNVTRAQMAKMITIIMLGDIDPAAFVGTTTDLKDINGHWAEGYIKYCYSQGVIAGKGEGKFDPDANVTAAEAAKMLLVAIGYNATVQGYVGGDWAINVIRDAQQSKFFDGLSVASTKVLTRDEAAQMIYNAVDADLIEKTPTLDITDGTISYTYRANSSGKDLLSETFGMYSRKGFLTDADYNSDTKKFSYTFNYSGYNATDVWEDATVTGKNAAGTSSVAFDVDLVSTTDYSALAGRYLKAMFKYDNKNDEYVAYGFYALDKAVSATVGELELGTDTADKKVKLADVSYKLEGVEGGIDVYVFVDNAVADTEYNLTAVAARADNASALTLVDKDNNGKYDYAVVVPATVAKVTYVGTKSITASGVYTFEDNTIYSGVAKNDFVKIIDKANTVYGESVITKVDFVEGKVTALKGTDIQVDGTWYKLAANTGDTAAYGDTVKLAVVGAYYYNVEVVDGKSLNNVLFVMQAGNLTGYGIGSGVEAKVMYAKDGSTATVKISKVDSTNATKVDNDDYVTELNGTDSGNDYLDAGNVVIGAMYTFKEKNGALELSTIADDVIGSYDFNHGTGAFTYSTTTPKVDGKVIADDAVVMAYDATNDKSSYTTGAVLKTWKTNWGDTAQYLYSKVNGVSTVAAVVLYDAAAIPGMSGTTGYGYVIDKTYYVEDDDNTGFAVMTLWTADGEITVKAEDLSNADSDAASPVVHSAFVAPSASRVKELDAAAKGAFVTYEKLANGNIGEVQTVGTAYALVGTYVNRDGETELTVDADGLTAAGSGTVVVTKDTQIIYVDTENVKGAEGSELALAQETTISGAYVLNVVIAGWTDGDGDDDDEVKVIFVDASNNLDSNAGLAASFTGQTNVTAANTTAKTLTIADGVSAATVESEVVTGFGALAAQLNDTNGDGNTYAGETVTIVAKDGTAVVYTIA